jgi:hypothetical protein
MLQQISPKDKIFISQYGTFKIITLYLLEDIAELDLCRI